MRFPAQVEGLQSQVKQVIREECPTFEQLSVIIMAMKRCDLDVVESASMKKSLGMVGSGI